MEPFFPSHYFAVNFTNSANNLQRIIKKRSVNASISETEESLLAEYVKSLEQYVELHLDSLE